MKIRLWLGIAIAALIGALTRVSTSSPPRTKKQHGRCSKPTGTFLGAQRGVYAFLKTLRAFESNHNSPWS